MKEELDKSTEAAEKEFKVRAQMFRAPGRVNLIGEHTDYNDGFVLPCAIGFYAHVAIAPRADHKLVLRSSEFQQQFEFDSSHLPNKKLGAWCDYVLGVATQLKRDGHSLTGSDMSVRSDVPVGSGLSSSAALEVAAALALLSLNSGSMPMKSIALLCQRAENEFVGAHVGIMDQFVSCHGKAGHAVMLDCRSLDFELVPIPQNVRLVICNTMVKHELSGGEYNERRAQCEEGVRLLAKYFPGVKALRDISPQQLESRAADLPDIIYRRCSHVVHEDQRVLEAVRSFGAGDLKNVGKLMLESHASLRDLYEVSCRELDVMVEAAFGLPGWYGGRMTGGGFGGCTVNMVEHDHAQRFAAEIAARYQKVTGIKPDVYVCSPADGAGAEAGASA